MEILTVWLEPEDYPILLGKWGLQWEGVQGGGGCSGVAVGDTGGGQWWEGDCRGGGAVGRRGGCSAGGRGGGCSACLNLSESEINEILIFFCPECKAASSKPKPQNCPQRLFKRAH